MWCAATITSRTRRSRSLLYRALGAPVPQFAHVPLILGAGQEAPEQASRRDVGDRVRERGLPARGDGELPRAARLVAGQRRSRAVLARRAGRGVRSRRHQRRQRRLQPREARLVQPAAHRAAGADELARAAAAVVRSGGSVGRRVPGGAARLVLRRCSSC